MRRITPRMVVTAYRKTGLLPVDGEYYNTNVDKQLCGCGMTAVALSRGNSVHGCDNASLAGDPERAFASMLGLNFEYVSGFVRGFDGWIAESHTANYEKGHADGKASREAVIKELGVML